MMVGREKGRRMVALKKNIAARIREAAVDWVFRLEDASVSAEERAAFQDWLAEDPRHAEAFEKAQAIMGDARLAAADQELDLRAPQKRSAIRGALVLLALAAGLWGAFVAGDGTMRLQADIRSPIGQSQVVKLADGSLMQLDADSAVAVKFDGQKRFIRLLRGQAFFTVARDAARPFVVAAADGEAQALGTQFGVSLSEDGTTVSVVEHAVRVSAGGSIQNGIDVQEGEEITYHAGGVLGSVRKISPGLAASWRRGQLVVDGATLSSVVAELGRYYKGQIYLTPGLAGRRISGTFNISDTDSALTTLEETVGIRARRPVPFLIILSE
jgi:transmembrane sensor